MTTIARSFNLAWALYASDYSRYLPADTPPAEGLLVHVPRLFAGAAWIEILGLAVVGQALGGESSDTIFGSSAARDIIGDLAMVAIFFGTVAVNAMNDYTGSLSLQAAGLTDQADLLGGVVAVLGFLFTLYLNAQTLRRRRSRTTCSSSPTGSGRGRRRPRRLAARRRPVDVSRLSRLRMLPSGLNAFVALVVGFLGRIPFQNSTLGYVGRTVQLHTANYLGGADIAYYVGGFVVAGAIYWSARATRSVRASAGLPVRRPSRPPPAVGRGVARSSTVSGRPGGRWTTGSRSSVATCAAISSQVAIHRPSIAWARSISCSRATARTRARRRTGGSSA